MRTPPSTMKSISWDSSESSPNSMKKPSSQQQQQQQQQQRRGRPSDPGDDSYQLKTVQTHHQDESLSIGSPVSADSFVYMNVSGDDQDDDSSYDPYLDNARRRQKKNRTVDNPMLSRTPMTAPLDDSSHSTPSISPRKLPDVLDIPMKMFDPPPQQQQTPQDASSTIQQRRSECPPRQVKALHERYFWNTIVAKRIQHHGTILHLRVAEGLHLLGNAHMNCKEYKDALKIYKSAVRIYCKLNNGGKGHQDLSVARSLDKVGLAACRVQGEESHTVALMALHEAFTIRYEILGAIHVDTVDSLNNIAGVHLRMREYHLARKAYHEVYIVRQIIFGPRHPSVAITAHALGGVHLKLAQLEDAARYYRRAMEIYKKLKLKPNNPTMARLLKDMASLERMNSISAATGF